MCDDLSCSIIIFVCGSSIEPLCPLNFGSTPNHRLGSDAVEIRLSASFPSPFVNLPTLRLIMSLSFHATFHSFSIRAFVHTGALRFICIWSCWRPIFIERLIAAYVRVGNPVPSAYVRVGTHRVEVHLLRAFWRLADAMRSTQQQHCLVQKKLRSVDFIYHFLLSFIFVLFDISCFVLFYCRSLSYLINVLNLSMNLSLIMTLFVVYIFN